MSILQLIRFPNLIIVALTQFLLYYQLILPALQSANITPSLGQPLFSLFVLVTLLITAGGYIINDLIDLEIDLLNKPERVIISRKIPHQMAYWLYFVFNLAGFVLALAIAFATNRMHLLFIFPFAVIGLLVYSKWLKKRPLSGNLLIAFYCAGVAAIVWIAELPALLKLPLIDYQQVIQLLLFYAGFAFLSTLFREIVKDIEDAQGDAMAGARTVPIYWGTKVAKNIALVIGILLLIFLGYVMLILKNSLDIVALLLLFGLGILICIGTWSLYKAENKMQFHQLSQFSKIIMLGGILLLLLF